MRPGGHLQQPSNTAVGHILEVSNLEVVYNDAVVALRGVSLAAPHGAIVAVLGGNGAGKTTLLRAVTGLLDAHDGVVTRGRVLLDDQDTTRGDSADIVRRGIALVPEGRRIFGTLTVEENLKAGGLTCKDRRERQHRIERSYEMFPVLGERRSGLAGYLSGGEQQMLAICRALMSDPRLLLLDEPSLGLAPFLVETIANTIREINATGTSVVLIEQNAHVALSIADHGYVLESGKVVLEGPAAELRETPDIRDFYLGHAGGESRRSFRDVKTYRRKKRWIS